MGYGQADTEDRLKLDPAIAEFMRNLQGGAASPPVTTPAPEAPAVPATPSVPTVAAPAATPMRSPLSSLDPKVIEFLQKHDAEAKEYNARRDLQEGIGRSMNYFTGKGVSAGFPPPKVDDEMQKFLIHQSTLRNYGSMMDPMRQPPTEVHIQQAVSMGMPEEVARGAPTLGTLSELVKQYGKPTKDPADLAPVGDYVERGAALAHKVTQQPGEKPAEFAKRVAQAEHEVALDKIRAQMASSGAVFLSPEAERMAAERYLVTGESPNLGMGRQGGAAKARILNKAAELGPDTNLAESTAGFKSTTKSLGELQAQADKVNAFERTALANLDTFIDQAKKVRDTGSPIFNKGGRAFDELVLGDPKMAAFNAARQTAVQEIGKILSGSLGNAGISDSARHEIEMLMRPDATVAQFMAAAEILKRDMHNRKVSVAAELADVKARAGSRPSAPSAPPSASAVADPLGIR